MDFMGFFPSGVDYPEYGKVNEILPLGELWSYVSNRFLNGFVNGCLNHEAMKCFVAGRYKSADEELRNLDRHYFQESTNSWVPAKEFFGDQLINKKAVYDAVMKSGSMSRYELDAFEDDVLILTKVKSEAGKPMYWFFWFDQDVSDCAIGRFKTDMPEEEVFKLFTELVMGPNTWTCLGDYHEPWEIPGSFFKSCWLKF